ncbi:MAG: alpha/beta hydrolase [Prevotellaceae bacterium]|jgi:dipeptidyl aminopeptidase/acylaminoacyl peptidase|nr:alpha/beta hydrolase [Prevotellaceae bacterium]
MKKITIIQFLLVFISVSVHSQLSVKNYVFAVRDTVTLGLDLYTLADAGEKNPVIVFVFGGGFITGSKSDEQNVNYCKSLAERGFTVAAIDYRLALKGVKGGVFALIKPLEYAIGVAVEDLYSAVHFLLQHADELGIDTDRVILNGSSAGAITVLQADYELCNGTETVKALPPDFRFAGVIAFAGAIFSREGKVTYKRPPAPTFLFHGMKDKLVFYDKMQIFRLGFFGSNAIVKRFEKFDYPYCIYRYRDMGHDIASYPMTRNLDDIVWFIDRYVGEKAPLRMDATIKDENLTPMDIGGFTPADLYK